MVSVLGGKNLNTTKIQKTLIYNIICLNGNRNSRYKNILFSF
jgi:hypothetical protein